MDVVRDCVVCHRRLITESTVSGQVPPAWEATPYFQYNIESVDFDRATRVAYVVFSVTNPWANDLPWDIKNDAPFTQLAPSAVSRLALDFGWNTREYTNTGSGSRSGAAYPISVDLLRNSTELFPDSGLYVTSAALPPQAVGSGVVAMEGHPAWPVTWAACRSTLRCPSRVPTTTFPLPIRWPCRGARSWTSTSAWCHDGTDIPRLSLHGANRTEELRVCVICHNPNQTDIPVPYVRCRGVGGLQTHDSWNPRRQDAEESPDHHRTWRLRQRLQRCAVSRRIEELPELSHRTAGLGTYQIPLAPSVLGSTINTGSTPGGSWTWIRRTT